MKTNFKDVKESTSNFPDRLGPGIHEVTVSNYLEYEPDPDKPEDKKQDGTVKTPYIEIKFVNEDGEHEQRFYTSEKALDITLGKLKHLSLAMVSEEELLKIKESKDLKGLLQDKKVRIKLCGEELDGKSGPFIMSKIQWTPFAENIDIPRDKSKLRFDEKKDIKYAEVYNKSRQVDAGGEKVENDSLPF